MISQRNVWLYCMFMWEGILEKSRLPAPEFLSWHFFILEFLPSPPSLSSLLAFSFSYLPSRLYSLHEIQTEQNLLKFHASNTQENISITSLHSSWTLSASLCSLHSDPHTFPSPGSYWTHALVECTLYYTHGHWTSHVLSPKTFLDVSVFLWLAHCKLYHTDSSRQLTHFCMYSVVILVLFGMNTYTKRWCGENYWLPCSPSAFVGSCPVLLRVDSASIQTKEKPRCTKPECSECSGPYSRLMKSSVGITYWLEKAHRQGSQSKEHVWVAHPRRSAPSPKHKGFYSTGKGVLVRCYFSKVGTKICHYIQQPHMCSLRSCCLQHF